MYAENHYKTQTARNGNTDRLCTKYCLVCFISVGVPVSRKIIVESLQVFML